MNFANFMDSIATVKTEDQLETKNDDDEENFFVKMEER